MKPKWAKPNTMLLTSLYPKLGFQTTKEGHGAVAANRSKWDVTRERWGVAVVVEKQWWQQRDWKHGFGGGAGFVMEALVVSAVLWYHGGSGGWRRESEVICSERYASSGGEIVQGDGETNLKFVILFCWSRPLFSHFESSFMCSFLFINPSDLAWL